MGESFEVHSTTSERIYVVKQSRTGRYWSCSCPGWKNCHHCKHLDARFLPPDELPYEVHIEYTGAAAEPPPARTYAPELSDFPDIDLESAVPPRFVVFDLETTGFDAAAEDIIEIGAIRVDRDSNVFEIFHSLVRPTKHIPKVVTQMTGICQDMVDRQGKPLETVMREFAVFIGNLPLVSYGADFDMRFVWDSARRYNIVVNNRVTCALKMSKRAWPQLPSHKLDDVAGAVNSR